MTQKYIKDGKVAVLVSKGYGAGWSTWNTDYPDCLFDPEIVQMLLDQDWVEESWDEETRDNEIVMCAESKYGEDFYTGGVGGLTVVWIEEGTQFYVHEYDGAECIKYPGNYNWRTA